MRCEDCQDLMMELLDDEAGYGDARAHLQTCASCAEEWQSLQETMLAVRSMAVVEAPELSPAVLAAARAAIQPAAPTWHLRLDQWRSMIAGWAMRPQLAMAMLLVLMVGVGLWYVPASQQPQDAMDAPILVPEPLGAELAEMASDLEAVEQTKAAAANETAASVEIRSGQKGELARAGDLPGAGSAERPLEGKAGLPDNAEPTAQGSGTRGKARRRPAATPRKALREAPKAKRRNTKASRAAADQDTLAGAFDLAESGATLGGSAGPSPAASKPAPAAPPPATAATRYRAQAAAETADRKTAAPRPEREAAPTSMDDSSGGSGGTLELYAQAARAYSRGNYREAASAYQRVLRAPDAGAVRVLAQLGLARSLRRLGQCATAIPYYERYTASSFARGREGSVVYELAECYQRTRRHAQAESALARIENDVTWGTRARKLQSKLRAEKAQGAAAAPTQKAAEAAAEAP